jgi:hypothetical protein
MTLMRGRTRSPPAESRSFGLRCLIMLPT